MSIRLVSFRNPLSAEREIAEHPHGASFRELVEYLHSGSNAIVFCGDERVDGSAWDDIPRDDSIVLIRIVPGEAVGQFIGKVAATVVLGTMAGIAWIFTGNYDSSFMQAIWGGPASSTKGDTSTTTLPSLKGASNSIDRWGAIPLILGKHYIAPKYAAQPYTEIAGADGANQYVHLALLVGYGPLSVSVIKIGENLLASNAADVRTGAITVDGQFPAADISIEIRQDASPMTWYPSRVTEDQFDITLKSPSGTPIYLYRTSAPGSSSLSVDFEFPSGLIKFDTSGNPSSATVRIVADYRPAGSTGSWTNFFDSTLAKQVKVTARYTGSVAVTAGQYEVRAYRVTADSTDSGVRDIVKWTALRSSISEEPVFAGVSPKVVRLSLKIKAGDVVNGTLSSINLIAQSIIPVYSGSGSGSAQWATASATSNPAAEALYLLRGSASPKPVSDSLIDWPAFEELYTWAETMVPAYPTGTEKRNPCNAMIDSQVTLREGLSKVLASGRASLTMRGPIFSLVHDVAKTTPVALITPRNSWDFQGAKAFAFIPHGYRISYINASAGYQSDQCIALADGYIYDIYNDGVTRDAFGVNHTTAQIYSGTTYYKLATELESIERWGLTSYSEAWREGRYALAKLFLRPELYSIRQDVESIGYTRGDRVRFGHDVPLFGVIGGRFKSIAVDGSMNALSFVSDEIITMAVGKTYGVRYQRAVDGAVLFSLINTSVGSSYSAVFTSAIPPATAPSPDDLFWFGESGLETIDAIVVGIEPSTDLSATIYLQDYSPGVFSADSGTIPNYNSHISLPCAQDMSSAGDNKADVTTAIAQAAAAQNGPASYVDNSPPTNNLTNLAISSEANADGSINVKLAWDYVQGSVTADAFQVYYKSATGTPSNTNLLIDSCKIVPAQGGTSSYAMVLEGLPANYGGVSAGLRHYRFSVIPVGTRKGGTIPCVTGGDATTHVMEIAGWIDKTFSSSLVSSTPTAYVNAGGNTYYDVATTSYTGTVTGYLQIKIPQPADAVYFSFDLEGYSGSNYTPWKLTIGGYNGTGSLFSALNIVATGAVPYLNSGIIGGYKSNGDKVILIGTAASAWINPSYRITKVTQSGNLANDWSTGWTMLVSATDPTVGWTTYFPSYAVNAGDSSYTEYGPNTTWSGKLKVGSGDFTADTTTGTIKSTNGNIHLDTDATKKIYLNYYSGGGVLFGDGATNVKATIDSAGNLACNNFHSQAGSRTTDNYNTRLNTGFYNGEGAPDNAPNVYGQLIVAQGIDTGLQIAGGYISDSLYFRGWWNNGAGFSAWRTVIHNGGGQVINGTLTASAVYGAVGNDFGDKLDLDNDGTGAGYVVSYHKGRQVRTTKRNDKAVMGIVTDTASVVAGDDKNKGLPIAVAGFVLAFVDRRYATGTKLTVGKDGTLTKARRFEKVIATYFDKIETEKWNSVAVNGRHLVRVE